MGEHTKAPRWVSFFRFVVIYITLHVQLHCISSRHYEFYGISYLHSMNTDNIAKSFDDRTVFGWREYEQAQARVVVGHVDNSHRTENVCWKQTSKIRIYTVPHSCTILSQAQTQAGSWMWIDLKIEFNWVLEIEFTVSNNLPDPRVGFGWSYSLIAP